MFFVLRSSPDMPTFPRRNLHCLSNFPMRLDNDTIGHLQAFELSETIIVAISTVLLYIFNYFDSMYNKTWMKTAAEVTADPIPIRGPPGG